ncbi:MAG: tol-pal system protein YbgF [Gallionella sp.]|nr:tol-pal system protein YbgF [Gallionella sp.]
MLKQRALLLLALCFVVPAQAGLFSDDDARKQIQQLEGRVQQLEGRIQQLEEYTPKLEDAVKQQTRSMLDLQGQIEALNGEIRKLRGQNEELAHGLQDAEKREKDFYVDLDTRLRRFESIDNAVQTGDNSPATVSSDPNDPTLENRAFEAAYGLFKGGSHANAAKAFQEFLKKYPGSVHVANANYWLGNAQLALKDYKNALNTYQGLLKAFPDTAKAADVLFDIAECQKGLEQDVAAQKTLKQLVTKYPTSEAAAKAKKQPATSK